MKTSRVIWIVLALVIVVGFLRFAHQQGLLGPRHKVTLRWTPSPSATSYKIYRTTVSGRGYVKVGTSDAASFVDKTVAANTVYYYSVTAVGADGSESARSAEIKAEVPQ
jgi:fibronectin type 3 domain-containing protein